MQLDFCKPCTECASSTGTYQTAGSAAKHVSGKNKIPMQLQQLPCLSHPADPAKMFQSNTHKFLLPNT